MHKKITKNYLISGFLFLLFVLLTIAVCKIDVKPIGPEQSSVGLSQINGLIFNLVGVNLLWYHITDWLGVIAIATAFCFAIIGLLQLIKRKNFLKVDFNILVLAAFYLLVIGFYLIFEMFIINYRPVSLYQNLEASYPSSHTMIVISIMATAMMQYKSLLKQKTLILVAKIVSAIIIAVTVLGRFISGVHWFTDILAGIILSASLCMLYYSVMKNRELIKNESKENRQDNS